MWRLTTLTLLMAHLGVAVSDDSAFAGLAAALSSHKTEEVRAWEQRLVSGDASAETLLSAGALLAQHEMLTDAATMFERCSQRFPSLFEAKYNLTLARIGLNDYTAAEKAIRSISPTSVREAAAVQYLRGKIYASTGRPAEALKSLESAYRGNPDEENYALDLGLLYIRSSAYVPAIQFLEPALARHPESEDLAIELALSNALAGRQAAALAVCQKLLEQNPHQSMPRMIAAFANCLTADYRACETEAAAGLALSDANPYLHYLYAEALWNSNSPDRQRALSELTAALVAMPSCSVCFLLRSKVFEYAKDYPAAIADVKAVLRQDAESGPAWYRLSALYQKTGESAEAANAVRRYRALREQQTDKEVESFREQFIGKANTRPDR
jgi:predicted Zn-dependent protease